MAYSVSSVSIGAFTRAADHNQLNTNIIWVVDKADVGHDFNTTTGDGYHRGLFSAPIIFKASASVFGSIWLDDTDATNIVFRMMSGVSAAAVTPAAKTDGVVIGVGGFV